MRSKLPKQCWRGSLANRIGAAATFGLAVWCSSPWVQAAGPTLGPYGPHALYGASPQTLYFSDSATTVDTEDDFVTVDAALTSSTSISGSMAGLVRFRVARSGVADNQVVSILAQTTNGWKYVPIAAAQGARCTSSTCQGESVTGYTGSADTYYFSAPFPGDDTEMEIGFFPADLCEAVRLQGDTSLIANGCTNGSVKTLTRRTSQTVNDSVTAVFNLRVYVTAAPDTTSAGPTDSTQDSNFTPLNVSLQTGVPLEATSSCPSLSALYFPGDTKIFFDTTRFNGSGLVNGAPLNSVVVVGANGTSPSLASIESNSVHGRLAFGGVRDLTGFTNTTNGSDNSYTLGFLIRDHSGALLPLSTCSLSGVQTSSIQTFLNQSRCFIATAAYGSGEVPTVRWLRQFRESALRPYRAGRAFIGWYESWSPRAAEWLLQHPEYRPAVLAALTPAVAFAGIYLHWKALLVVAWVGLLAAGLIRWRRAALLLVLLGIAAPLAHADQPYIDRIKRSMSEEEALSDASPSEGAGYTEKLKGELKSKGTVSDPGKNYTGRIQSLIQDEQAESGEKPDSSEAYTSTLKRKLAPAQPEESAIARVKQGESELRIRKEGEIHFLGGFQLGASATRSVRDLGGVTNAPLETVYGTSWVPDVRFHMEWQPFHSEWFGNLGFQGTAGFTLQTGKASFQFPLNDPVSGEPFGSTSRTELRFITVPVTVGATYRFNLLQWIRPYVQASGLMVGYSESRSDGLADQSGYSTGVSWGGGANFLLNPIFPSAARELYLSSGVHHLYLSIDWNQQWAKEGGLEFRSNTVSAGLSYEF